MSFILSNIAYMSAIGECLEAGHAPAQLSPVRTCHQSSAHLFECEAATQRTQQRLHCGCDAATQPMWPNKQTNGTLNSDNVGSLSLES